MVSAREHPAAGGANNGTGHSTGSRKRKRSARGGGEADVGMGARGGARAAARGGRGGLLLLLRAPSIPSKHTAFFQLLFSLMFHKCFGMSISSGGDGAMGRHLWLSLSWGHGGGGGATGSSTRPRRRHKPADHRSQRRSGVIGTNGRTSLSIPLLGETAAVEWEGGRRPSARRR